MAKAWTGVKEIWQMLSSHIISDEEGCACYAGPAKKQAIRGWNTVRLVLPSLIDIEEMVLQWDEQTEKYFIPGTSSSRCVCPVTAILCHLTDLWSCSVAEILTLKIMDLEKPTVTTNEKESNNHPIELRVAKGMRDFGPEQMTIRQEVLDTITAVFKRHGAITIATPIMELKSLLTGRYGEDEKLIYDMADQGSGTSLSLRYDLTVPFARYVAMNGITKIKRYQIGEVYRRDNPVISKGRYRAFYQCDFDIAGDYGDSRLPDAECLHMLDEILSELDIGRYEIKINHRAILNAIYQKVLELSTNKPSFDKVCSSIDKLDKTPWDEVAKELDSRGLSQEAISYLKTTVTRRGSPKVMIEELRSCFPDNVGINDLARILSYLDAYGVDWTKYSFDLSLARGLSYYTGMIVEVVFLGSSSMGSIAGGGRYDDLIGMFNGKGTRQIPSVGFSIGLERIFAIKEEQMRSQHLPIKPTATFALVACVSNNPRVACVSNNPRGACVSNNPRVACVGNNPKVAWVDNNATIMRERLRLCNELWTAGFPVETLYNENPKMKEQLEYALNNQIPYILLIGEAEVAANTVQLKDVKNKRQWEVPRVDLLKHLSTLFELEA